MHQLTFRKLFQQLVAFVFCYLAFDKFGIERFHVRQHDQFVNTRHITDIHILLCVLRIGFTPLLCSATPQCQVKQVGLVSVCYALVYISDMGNDKVTDGIGMQGVVHFAQDAFHVPFTQKRMAFGLFQPLVFLDEIKLELRA